MGKKKVVLRRDNSLLVKITEAKDLEGADNVFVVVNLDGKENSRTRVISANPKNKGLRGLSFTASSEVSNPFWSEEYLFENLPPHFQILQVVVYGKSKTNHSKGQIPLGMIQIPRDILMTASDQENWYPLREVDCAMAPLGDIRIQMEAYNTDDGPHIRVHVVEGKNIETPLEHRGKFQPQCLGYVEVCHGEGHDGSDDYISPSELGISRGASHTNPKFDSEHDLSLLVGNDQSQANVVVTIFSTGPNDQSKIIVGKALIPIKLLQTGIKFDSWYPLAKNPLPNLGAELVGGQVRMKIKYQENIILPLSDYKQLWKVIESVPFPLFSGLNSATHNKEEAGTALVRLYGSKQSSRFLLRRLIDLEIAMNNGAGYVLFRSNSITTKGIDYYMKSVGHAYLKDTIGPVIEQIIEQRKVCEVNPSFVTRGSNVKKNFRNLEGYVRKITDSILNSVRNCPAELRGIFGDLQRQVIEKLGPNLRYTAVSSFLFLRFFCAAIMGPKLFGLVLEFPDERASRTLTLVAKTVQCLSSLVRFAEKEQYMIPMNAFIEEYESKMKHFLDNIGTSDSLEHEYNLDIGKEFSVFYRHVAIMRPQLQEYTIKNQDKDEQDCVSGFIDIINHLSGIQMAYRSAGQMRFKKTEENRIDVSELPSQYELNISNDQFLTGKSSSVSTNALCPAKSTQSNGTALSGNSNPNSLTNLHARERERILKILHTFTSQIVCSVSAMLNTSHTEDLKQVVTIAANIKQAIFDVCIDIQTSSYYDLVEKIFETLKLDADILIKDAQKCKDENTPQSIDQMMQKAYTVLKGTKKLIEAITEESDSIQLADSVSNLLVSETKIPESNLDYKDVLDSIKKEIAPPTGVVVIVCTGIDQSSPGNEATVHSIKIYNDVLRRSLRKNNGYEVASQGGDFLCAFTTLFDGIKWSKEVQLELLEANWPEDILNEEKVITNGQAVTVFRGPRVQIGINSGPVDSELDSVTSRMEYSGDSLNLAKTLRDHAVGGQILILESVWEGIPNKNLLDLDSRSLGKYRLTESVVTMVQQILPASLAARNFPKSVQNVDFDRRKYKQTLKQQMVCPEGHVAVVSSSIQYLDEIRDNNHSALLQALSIHDEICRKAIEYWHGYEMSNNSQGSFNIVFQCIDDALAWMLLCHDKLKEAKWPADILEMDIAKEVRGGPDNTVVLRGPRVQMGLDYGPVSTSYNSLTSRMQYAGKVVDRAEHIRDMADGGQAILTESCLKMISDDHIEKLGVHVNQLGTFKIKNSQIKEPLVQVSNQDISFYNFIINSGTVINQPLNHGETDDFNVLMSIMKQYKTNDVEAENDIAKENENKDKENDGSEVDEGVAVASPGSRASDGPIKVPSVRREVVVVDPQGSVADGATNTCFECSKDILPEEYDWISVCGKSFHKEHFRCHVCLKSLAKTGFVEGADSHMYCVADYEKTFGEVCCVCKEIIGSSSMCVRACGKVYHPHHFVCNYCSCSLVGQTFIEQYGQPYCEADFNDILADKCATCSKPVKDTEFIEALKLSWHIDCFHCFSCKKLPQEGDGMYSFDDEPHCGPCYKEKRYQKRNN